MSDHHDDELLARLRELPRDRVPPARIWAAVARQVEAMPRPGPLRRSRRRLAAPFAGAALAASLALALAIVFVPGLRSVTEMPDPVLQAEWIAGEYRQALTALAAPDSSPELDAALLELDLGLDSIHAAIRESPDSQYLLDQLRRTYALRLQLTRQAAFGAVSSST